MPSKASLVSSRGDGPHPGRQPKRSQSGAEPSSLARPPAALWDAAQAENTVCKHTRGGGGKDARCDKLRTGGGGWEASSLVSTASAATGSLSCPAGSRLRLCLKTKIQRPLPRSAGGPLPTSDSCQLQPLGPWHVSPPFHSKPSHFTPGCTKPPPPPARPSPPNPFPTWPQAISAKGPWHLLPSRLSSCFSGCPGAWLKGGAGLCSAHPSAQRWERALPSARGRGHCARPLPSWLLVFGPACQLLPTRATPALVPASLGIRALAGP